MTSKRWVLLLSASIAASVAACDRDDERSDYATEANESPESRERAEPAQISARDPAVDPRPEPVARERAAAEPAPEPESAASPRAVPTDTALTARRAEASFDTVGGAKLEAKAALEETSDGVAVVVRVEDAKPGTRSVRIYDRADCDGIPEKPLGEPLAGTNKQGDLGSVTIGPSGKGTLESKAFNTSLKPDDRASLLGKAIVMQERDGTSPKSDGDPIACAVIKPEAKLADKAGRMTEPTP